MRQDDELELPDVGGGRGSAKTLPPDSLQPIVYRELPVSFFEGMFHAVSASAVIDLTPQTGRFATWCVTNQIGYVGICQSEEQKNYILKATADRVQKALSDPSSKLYSDKFRLCEAEEVDDPNPRPKKEAKLPALPSPSPTPKSKKARAARVSHNCK